MLFGSVSQFPLAPVTKGFRGFSVCLVSITNIMFVVLEIAVLSIGREEISRVASRPASNGAAIIPFFWVSICVFGEVL